MMSSFHGGKITVYVARGDSYDVSISSKSGVLNTFTRGGEPVEFPVTITSDTEFNTDFDGRYTLSIQSNGVECATNLGTTAEVELHFDSFFSVTPSTEKAKPVVPTFEPPAPPEPVVVAPEPVVEAPAEAPVTDGPTLV